MELLPVLENIFESKIPDVAFLKRILRAAKPNLLNIFKNSPKNVKSREQIFRLLVDGNPIQKFEMLTLTKDMAEEVLILSDMYDLDELISLELLNTARDQNQKYPKLCRGLVAILLYYNAHRRLVSSLRLLIKGSIGRTWIPRIDAKYAKYLGKFVDRLMKNGLFINILIILGNKDLSKEIELLRKNKAIGDPKHHQSVVSLFTDICTMLAECVFYYSVQFGLSKLQLIRLLQYLQNIKSDVESHGVVSKVTLYMVTSFLYAIDFDCMNNTQEISDDDKELFLSVAYFELITHNWKWPELKSIATFGLAVAFSKLHYSQHVFKDKRLYKIDETLMSCALDNNILRFLNQNVAPSEFLYYVEFMIKKFHQLISEFIVMMSNTVNEIRKKSDEIAHKQFIDYKEGLDSPTSDENHFEQLLMLMAIFYAKDPLGLNLNLDYWPPSQEQLITIKISSFLTNQKFQASLYRFICQTGDMLPPMLFVPYLNLLSSFATSETGAENVFNHFHSNLNNSNLTWDHFFKTFLKYYINMRQEKIPLSDTVYKRNLEKGVTTLEIQGLQAVLKLIRNVAEQSIKSKVTFVDHSEWETIRVLLGLVSCPVIISLKADLILTLSTLVKPPPLIKAINFWQTLEASQIIVTVPTISSYQSNGIMAELNDLEPRNEEYPLTIALLKLLLTLTEQPIPTLLGSNTRTPGFDPYLNLVLNNIFLKCLSRGYKKQNEKWEVSRLCLELALKFLNQYEPQRTDFMGSSVMLPNNTTININPPPGFHIMTYLCTNSDFLRTILNIIHMGGQMFDLYTSFSGKEAMEKTTLAVLHLLEQALNLQQIFFNESISSGLSLKYTGIHKTLVSVNVATNEPDYIIDLSKFVTYKHLPDHAHHAIQILMTITSYPISQSRIVSYLTSNHQFTFNIRHGFVECLEEDESTEFLEESNDMSSVKKSKESILKLLLQCSNFSSPNLTYYLLGFNLDNVQKTCFENAGVGGNPRNCLHSIIDILDESLKSRKNGPVCKHHSKLLELCYQLIYVLVSSNQTSKPVLVYLKSRNDFILHHASTLPFYTDSSSKKVNRSELIQMNWLLRIIAVEIKMHRHQNFLMTLFNGPKEKKNNILGPKLLQSQSSNNSFDHSALNRDPDDGKKLLRLLEIVILDNELIFEDLPKLKYIEPTIIDQLLGKCEMLGKVPLIDVKQLHLILMNESKSIYSSSIVRTSLLQEIQELLEYAVRINDKHLRVNCMVKYFDAWHQLTAAICNMTNLPSMEFQQYFKFIIDLLVTLQSKSLLNKIATYNTGADALLNHQAIACLSLMKAIDARPNLGASFNSSMKNSMPNEDDRYMMICSPAMCLCQTILSTQGNKNMTSILQVVFYLVSHCDTVTIILTNSAPLGEQWYLKELYQLTSLFVCITNDDASSEINSSGDKDIAGLFYHYSMLMRKTLKCFCLNFSIMRKKCSEESSPNYGETNVTLYLRITLNLLNYVSNLMDGGLASDQKFKKPILDICVNTDSFCTTSHGDLNPGNILSMNTIITIMVEIVEHYFGQIHTKTKTDNRKSPIQLFGESSDATDIENNIISDQTQHILCKQIVEVCLYILWAHTNYYLTQSPVKHFNSTKELNSSRSSNKNDEDGVTSEELKELRQELVKVFNKEFLENLYVTNEDKPGDSFIQDMVHRIKKLLQFVDSKRLSC
ncbi:hypothetical protein QTP88_028342 [Uroleucon formosanum]